jgi:hypothetical protein
LSERDTISVPSLRDELAAFNNKYLNFDEVEANQHMHYFPTGGFILVNSKLGDLFDGLWA